MNQVKVIKSELVKILKTNRQQHREEFLKAQENYRKLVVNELDGMLKSARDGENIRRHVNLLAPEDHTKDYDLVIKMLDMSVEEEIVITQQQFNNYVNDDWNWAAAKTINTMYASGMGRAENGSLPSSY